jgi:hypothetical protein
MWCLGAGKRVGFRSAEWRISRVYGLGFRV